MGPGAGDTKLSKTKIPSLEWLRQTHKQSNKHKCQINPWGKGVELQIGTCSKNGIVYQQTNEQFLDIFHGKEHKL